LAFAVREDIPLDGQRIPRAEIPVRTEAAVQPAPAIDALSFVCQHPVRDSGVLAENPVRTRIAGRPPVTKQSAGIVHGSRACSQETALGRFGGLGDDIDDPVHRVGAPNGGARAANHFNALYILQRHSLLIPKHARKRR
jgi:hypothetical protein